MTNVQRVDGGMDAHWEGASGVSVERRALVWLPLAIAGGSLMQGAPVRAEDEASAPGRGREDAFAPLSFEQLGARWTELAKALQLAPKEADECYAAQLAGLLARVRPESLPRLENGRAGLATDERDGLVAGASWFLAPCVMVEYRLQPGAELKRHNHPPQVVLTLGLAGETRYEHYEIEGTAPPCTQIDDQEFRVRQTRTGFLKPGRTTALTRVRDGIHGFVAGKEGARLVDFTVTLGEDFETFSYVGLSPEPIDAERRVFGAVWTGKQGY